MLARRIRLNGKTQVWVEFPRIAEGGREGGFGGCRVLGGDAVEILYLPGCGYRGFPELDLHLPSFRLSSPRELFVDLLIFTSGTYTPAHCKPPCHADVGGALRCSFGKCLNSRGWRAGRGWRTLTTPLCLTRQGPGG